MGIYWIDLPIDLNMSREPSGYDLDAMTPWEKAILFKRWHSWWTADWDYALTTVGFLSSAIFAAFVLNKIAWLRGRTSTKNGKINLLDKMTAAMRYTVARQFYLRPTDWYTPPLAASIGVCGFAIFVLTLTLAVRPYYWPNDAMGMSPPIATRAGWISVAIMPFMIAFATKINFVAILTDTSHEKLQVFHRWTAFFMYITSLVHTFPFIITSIRMGMMQVMWGTTSLYWTGVAALVPQTWLIAMSWGPIRSRYYEAFKKLHFAASCVFMAMLFCHVDWIFTSWHYFYATAALYTTAWLTRVVRTFYTSGLGLPASIDSAGPDLVRIRITPRPRVGFAWTPGQHVFIRVLGLGIHALTSHPFTVASVKTKGEEGEGVVELVLRARGGLTRALQRRVEGTPGWTTRVVLDGPYGGLKTPRPLEGYDRVVLLAGGTGASFTLPLFTNLVKSGSESDTKVDFVVAVPNVDNFEWMAPQIAAAAAQKAGTANTCIRVHYTRAGADSAELGKPPIAKDAESESESVSDDAKSVTQGPTTTNYGRPSLPTIVREAHASASRVAIIACGPDSFLYDVRNAVAACQLDITDGFGPCRDLFMHTETYSW
ncbi:Ferric-chelate reductase [Mycena kentingensis (nom. inval.)]|nr:Ferric-chelate reductase [Mycena kentingensis (nom. inval.)]